MVGGGIFATTGLTVELTHGAAPLAFVLGGVVAFLTAYTYWKLTLRYPSEGGTVEFLNRGFGTGVLTGAASILLCLAYVVLLAIYAYAFGAYLASFFPPERHEAIRRIGIAVVIGGSALVNVVSASLVIRSENLLNATKLALLGLLVLVGLATPMAWERLAPAAWASPGAIASGAMIVFFNYEGFELIANAGREVRDPRRALPIAYLGGVGIVMVAYLGIVAVVLGHMTVAEVRPVSDWVLSAVADRLLGTTGHVVIAAAAMLATASAINATFYGSGRLTYVIARSGELPAELEREIRGQPLEGMLIFAVLSLVLALVVPLGAIAAMGSAGFLLVFLVVNLAGVRLATEAGASRIVCGLGAVSCAAALGLLCLQVWARVETRWQLLILAAMVLGSLMIEVVYRGLTARAMRLGRTP